MSQPMSKHFAYLSNIKNPPAAKIPEQIEIARWLNWAGSLKTADFLLVCHKRSFRMDILRGEPFLVRRVFLYVCQAFGESNVYIFMRLHGECPDNTPPIMIREFLAMFSVLPSESYVPWLVELDFQVRQPASRLNCL